MLRLSAQEILGTRSEVIVKFQYLYDTEHSFLNKTEDFIEHYKAMKSANYHTWIDVDVDYDVRNIYGVTEFSTKYNRYNITLTELDIDHDRSQAPTRIN